MCFSITVQVWSNDSRSAHPYEEPAYEVYKMEDL